MTASFIRLARGTNNAAPFWLAVFLPPVACVVFAVRTLTYLHRNPSLRGQPLAIVALCLSALSTVTALLAAWLVLFAICFE